MELTISLRIAGDELVASALNLEAQLRMSTTGRGEAITPSWTRASFIDEIIDAHDIGRGWTILRAAAESVE